MSSMLLLKDYDSHKKGAVISVPFGVGKLLIADGVGVYPGSVKTEPAKPTVKAQAAHGGEVKAPEPKAPEALEPLKPAFPPQPAPQGAHKK